MNYTRLLKRGMSGADVRYMKDLLFELGYYSKTAVKAIGNNIFGGDTLIAVEEFQSNNKDSKGNKLDVDGVIGELTWNSIVTASKIKVQPPVIISPLKDYTHIAADKRILIEKDLKSISDLRRDIVKLCLEHAYDKDVPGNVRALYMIGQNLYNKDLTLNIATKEKIELGARNSPSYYDGGRKEWMLEQVKRNPSIPAADCSGLEVGYLRKYGLVDVDFDTTANNFTLSTRFSTPISIEELVPGDWVGKEGHIGTYVGGEFVVEFYGGALGCQLTKLDNRVGYNFVNKINTRGMPWTRFRRPIYY